MRKLQKNLNLRREGYNSAIKVDTEKYREDGCPVITNTTSGSNREPVKLNAQGPVSAEAGVENKNSELKLKVPILGTTQSM